MSAGAFSRFREILGRSSVRALVDAFFPGGASVVDHVNVRGGVVQGCRLGLELDVSTSCGTGDAFENWTLR